MGANRSIRNYCTVSTERPWISRWMILERIVTDAFTKQALSA